MLSKGEKGIHLGYDPASLNHCRNRGYEIGVRALVLGGNWHLVVINSTEKVRQVETHRPFFPCLCGIAVQKHCFSLLGGEV